MGWLEILRNVPDVRRVTPRNSFVRRVFVVLFSSTLNVSLLIVLPGCPLSCLSLPVGFVVGTTFAHAVSFPFCTGLGSRCNDSNRLGIRCNQSDSMHLFHVSKSLGNPLREIDWCRETQ